MPIKVTAEPLDVTADAVALVADLQAACERHWQSTFLAGNRAEGGALPSNKRGQPYGVGDGSIATEWVTGPVQGDARRATATSAPGQDGGLFYVVRNLVTQGADPASVDGKTADIIDMVVSKHADRAVKA